MNCIKCKSHRTMKFIDGHGESRVFCRSCGISYLEHMPAIMHPDQRNVMGLHAGLYYRPGIIPFK